MEIGVVVNPVTFLLIAILLGFLEYFIRPKIFGVASCFFLALSFIDFIFLDFTLYQIFTWGAFLCFLGYLILKMTFRGTWSEVEGYRKLIGYEGVVVVALDPFGMIWIEGTTLKAKAEDNSHIERGKIVRMVGLTPNNRAIVRRA